MPDTKAIFHAAGGYLKHHPEELLRALRNAAGFKLGVPLDALRWLAGQARGRKAPKDVEFEAVPPGIRASATVDAMGTPVRASAVITIEHVLFNDAELRLEVRLSDVSLKVLDETSESPLAGLLKSGSLDLSKPGNLIGFLPKRPKVLVDAQDDRLVIDLKRLPKLQKNEKVSRALALVAPLLTVRSIRGEPEHLDVKFGAFPNGVGDAIAVLRRLV